MRMIKKVPLLLLALMVVPGLTACSSVNGGDRQPETSGESQAQDSGQIFSSCPAQVFFHVLDKPYHCRQKNQILFPDQNTAAFQLRI